MSNGLQYIGHTGGFDNFNSVIGFFPDKKIAFALLINSESDRSSQLTSENGIENRIAELLNQDVINKTTEGNSNHMNYFKLALNQALSVDVSVNYQTRDNTAIAGKDYVETKDTVTIRAGKTSQTIGIEIIADDKSEKDEIFSLVLTNPSGANFPDGVQEIVATHTIIDDD